MTNLANQYLYTFIQLIRFLLVKYKWMHKESRVLYIEPITIFIHTTFTMVGVSYHL